jgi:Transposase
MDEVSTIGIDIAKHVFQLHGVDGAGEVVLRRRLRRGQVVGFFAALPRCIVGIEACGTAHFWAREIARCGHDVRLMPPGYVKPYVKRNKHDAADAEAVCEAVRRPSMRFVLVKTAEQQAALVAHTVRDLLVRQRTMLVNALRGHLAEFGIVAPRGLQKVDELAAVVADESDERLPRARARRCEASSRSSPRSTCGSPGSRPRSSLGPRRTPLPGVSSRSLASVRSSPRASRPWFRTLRSSDRVATLPHGSGWCRGKARRAASPVSAAFPNAATGACDACSSAAPWRRCSARRRCKAIPGFVSCGPASRRWSRRSHSPTRSRAPSGRSCGATRSGGRRRRDLHPDRTSLAPCSPPSRPCRLRRWPSASLDRGCARRPLRSQVGTKKRLSDQTKKLKRETYPHVTRSKRRTNVCEGKTS